MTRSTPLVRIGIVAVIAGAALAACSGGAASPSAGAPTTAPSASTGVESTAPSASTGAASPSESMGAESPSASAGASMAPSFAPSGSPTARTVQVQAFEGGFMNAPVDPVPGTVLTFRNVGVEAHEMVVLRRNDDAAKTQTFDDLAKLDPAKLLTFVTVVGVLAADPGQEAAGQIVLAEPGDYAIVDLLAKGTTTAPASPDPLAIPKGIPNVASGMVAVFTVVAPDAS